MEKFQRHETWVFRFKRRWVPPGSFRENIWIKLVQLYRLYLRDGVGGVYRFLLLVIRGGSSIVPAWWYSTIKDTEKFREWESFLSQSVAISHKGLIIFYAGVPYIDTQPLRTVWLARTLISFGYRVLFVYWRWRPTEINPEIKNLPELFQMPMDVFWTFTSEILGDEHLQDQEKIFFAEFPHPSLFKIINLANGFGWTTIAEQKDDWEEFQKVGQANWYNSEFETYLFNNVDLLIATAPNLAEKMRKKVNKSVFIIPNAYDPESLNLDQEIINLEKGEVTIGYFGGLTPAWFDWEMLIGIARNHPTWKIYLIGRGTPLDSLPANIYLLGVQPHNKLAGFSKNWDLAIIPFKISELTRGVDPLKVYEYLAMGLRVITSGMHHLTNLPNVRNVEKQSDFEQAIVDSLSETFDANIVNDYLKDQTWVNRTTEILKLVTQNIKRQ